MQTPFRHAHEDTADLAVTLHVFIEQECCLVNKGGGSMWRTTGTLAKPMSPFFFRETVDSARPRNMNQPIGSSSSSIQKEEFAVKQFLRTITVLLQDCGLFLPLKYVEAVKVAL